jgi:hypothetical protein
MEHMASDDEEVPLHGGLVDRVVRVGATVRRPPHPWSASVQRLLGHLSGTGLAPEPLGFDGSGREVVSFIEGRPSVWPFPEALRRDDGIRAVGALLRRVHAAVADYRPPEGERWHVGRRDLGPGEVVLHGDIGPSNVIWRGDVPVALIDWELAEPGLPIRDLAQAAQTMVPLAPDDRLGGARWERPPDRRARLACLVDGYGDHRVGEVLDAVEALLAEEVERIDGWGGEGREPWATFLRMGLAERSRSRASWLQVERAHLGRRT